MSDQTQHQFQDESVEARREAEADAHAPEQPNQLEYPNGGNPDAEAGADSPDQRPITDNKAGG